MITNQILKTLLPEQTARLVTDLHNLSKYLELQGFSEEESRNVAKAFYNKACIQMEWYQIGKQ